MTPPERPATPSSVYDGRVRSLVNLKHSNEETRIRKRSVLYLRVSTAAQVNTDYDPEGISISAQRTACERKAAQMGIDILDEYVEPGRSATNIDRRPVFQAMMNRIQTDRDVDYIVVYALSRMNRNWAESAASLLTLRKNNVTLVSATENIDDTPEGQMLMGVLAALNQFRSQGDGADIRYKMGEKARKGGTLGRAPLGYLNVRERVDGREVRTVAMDAERAPFVKTAFELYATGEYSIDQLQAVLAERGLVGRSGRHRPGPVSTSKIQAMLRDPYYCGIIVYDGDLYKGRHEPLITEELFERVQRVFETRATAGERLRKHPHYLKGSIWCGHCHDNGHESRLLVQRTVGKSGGEYFYFFCSRKQDNDCRSRYTQIEQIEDAITRYYQTIRFAADFVARVRPAVHDTLQDQTLAAKLLHDQIKERIGKLDRQETNLVDLAADGTVPNTKIRERLHRIADERAKLEQQLEGCDEQLEIGAAVIEAALTLVEDPETLYRESGPKFRRVLNQTMFDKLYIDDGEVSGAVMREPFGTLKAVETAYADDLNLGRRRRPNSDAKAPTSDLLVAALADKGSSKTLMVELTGFEPVTSCMPCKRSTN